MKLNPSSAVPILDCYDFCNNLVKGVILVGLPVCVRITKETLGGSYGQSDFFFPHGREHKGPQIFLGG